MFNSKLTKVAALVAFTAAGAANANTITFSKLTAGSTPTNTAATTAKKAKELSAVNVAQATHEVVYGEFNDSAGGATSVDVIAFNTTTEVVDSDHFIELNFTNGGISEADASQIELLDISDLTAITSLGTVAKAAFLKSTKDSSNLYITSLRFQIPGSTDLAIGKKFAIVKSAVLATSHDADLSTTGTAGTTDTDITPLNLYVAKGLAKGDKVGVTAKVINNVTLSEITSQGAATAANLVEVVDGYTATKATAVTSSVDFTKDAFQFVSTGYNSATTAGAKVATDGGLVIDTSDSYDITVTGTACDAVDKAGTNDVSFGGVALSYVSGCTWTATANNSLGTALAASGGANLSVTVNNGTDATTAAPNTKIQSATWAYSVDVTENTTNQKFALFSGANGLTWSGNVQGTNAYVPYMYATDIAGYLSIAKLTNNTAAAVNVGVTVVLDDVDADGTDYSGKETDIFVTTIPAGEMATINGNMIKAAIEGKDSAGEALTIPANRGFKTSGFKTLASEGFNYHMNVSFTFDGATAADGVDVTLQNAGPNSRANGSVYYGSTRTKR